MKHLVTAATPLFVAAFALPALAAPTPVASKTFQDVKKAAWGVVLPDPKDLLLDTESPAVLFDALDTERTRPLRIEPKKSAKVPAAKAK